MLYNFATTDLTDFPSSFTSSDAFFKMQRDTPQFVFLFQNLGTLKFKENMPIYVGLYFFTYGIRTKLSICEVIPGDL